MSATATDMRVFIEHLLDELPPIRPGDAAGGRVVCRCFVAMSQADRRGDYAEVVRLMRVVRAEAGLR